MGKRRASSVARMDAVLAVLKESGKAMRVLDVARKMHSECPQVHYSPIYVALHRLVDDGLVEKVGADEMHKLVPMGDGRVLSLGPDAGAVGFRAVSVDPDTLAVLEALWDAPAVDRA